MDLPSRNHCQKVTTNVYNDLFIFWMLLPLFIPLPLSCLHFSHLHLSYLSPNVARKPPPIFLSSFQDGDVDNGRVHAFMFQNDFDQGKGLDVEYPLRSSVCEVMGSHQIRIFRAVFLDPGKPAPAPVISLVIPVAMFLILQNQWG
jgi:hypothetical protein